MFNEFIRRTLRIINLTKRMHSKPECQSMFLVLGSFFNHVSLVVQLVDLSC